MQYDTFIEDNALADFLRSALRNSDAETRLLLKNVANCGHRIIPALGMRKGVVVLSNGKRSTFSGLAFCDNVFCCPHCQARLMVKYAERIKLALAEMKKLGYRAIMATFTFPHLRFLTCRDSVLVLRQMKQNFLKKTKGSTAQNFLDDLGIKDYIWSAEFTHGGNGWHPHYHTLFWVKADKFAQVANWEQKIKTLWLNSARRYMKRLKPKFASVIDKLFEKANNERGGVYFSKNSDGSIREMTAGNYMLGWTANKELTQLENKTAHKGHRTTRQLLEDAYNGSRTALKLYIEFCKAVRVSPTIRRVQYSHGFVSKIKQWEQVAAATKLTIKKKEAADFVPVVWFTPEQWRYICYETQPYTRSNILYLARLPNLLMEYLQNLQIPYELPETNSLCTVIQNSYNAAIAC